MIIIWQILLGVVFLLLSILIFTCPFYFLFRKQDEPLEKIVISTVFGLVIFTLAAYLLAAVHLRFLMYGFPLLGIWSIFHFKKDLSQLKLKFNYKLFFLLVFITGIIGQVAVNAFSGFPYEKGIYFYSSHGHDGVWHLSLMEKMHTNNFPFQNPELAGEKLQNYHFFVDLLMSEFSRLFYFSNLDIYFRFMPVVFSILLGLTSFIFVKAWSKSELAGIWAMFFTYWAGSFGYFLYVPTHGSLGGESIFWVSQTQSVLGNPPHAAAFIITTTFLYLFLKYLTIRKFSLFLLCALLGGAVIEFKVYAGVLILGGLLVIGIFEALFKRIYSSFLLFISTLIIALGIYLPNSANSQDFLIWQPWWFIRTMVVATDRLNWLDLELRRQTYIAENNWKRVIQVEATAFFIFLWGNLGMRIWGFWPIFKQIRENIFKNSFNLFFITITTASFFIPVFFLQKGVAWNAIQFNQYFLLFFGFLAGIGTDDLIKLFKPKLSKIIVSLVIIILAIPTQVGLLWQFYSNNALSKVTYEELKALDFLKKQGSSEDVVLTAPFNKYERQRYSEPPIPIYSWYDTGYVSAFSGKQSLITDEEQITIMGYDVKKLLEERQIIFQTKDENIINDFLKKNKVDYVYLVWGQKFATESATLNLDMVYENKDAKIFKVKK